MTIWEILNRDKSELIHRIYTTQKISNSTGDWVRLVEADKKELGIDLTDKQIQEVSKSSFKTYVKKKVTQNFLQHLKYLKSRHSKSKFLSCDKLRVADYLQSPLFTTKEKELLFKLRSQTLDVKQNFPGQYGSMFCRSCGLFPESQSHLLQCPVIVSKLQTINKNYSRVNEGMIYGDIEEQQIIVNIYSEVLLVRESLEEVVSPQTEGPNAPSY